MRLAPPELVAHGIPEAYTVENDRTGEMLAALLTPESPALPGRTVGLTTARFDQALNYALVGVPGPGFICLQPRVSATLTLKAPRIDVADEFTPGSCRYQEILAHELQHVQAYQAQLKGTTEALKNAFAERYPPGSFIRLNESAEAPRLQEAELQGWLVPFVTNSLAEVSARHRQIDTLDEYTRLSRACPQEPLQ